MERRLTYGTVAAAYTLWIKWEPVEHEMHLSGTPRGLFIVPFLEITVAYICNGVNDRMRPAQGRRK
ncbi:uncharacterized protein Dvar_80920 [Desulfosarcina variabilis str. Montpellier]